ncbi:MAG: hypothetical protein ACK4GC_01365 [Paracoccaceae bacterium]
MIEGEAQTRDQNAVPFAEVIAAGAKLREKSLACSLIQPAKTWPGRANAASQLPAMW